MGRRHDLALRGVDPPRIMSDLRTPSQQPRFMRRKSIRSDIASGCLDPKAPGGIGWPRSRAFPPEEEAERPIACPLRRGLIQEALMPVRFDAKTLERFRTMTPHEIYREVTEAVHQVEGPK